MREPVMRRGAILLFSLIVMAITVIVTGALSTYYVNTASLARFYGQSRAERRVGSAKAIESAIQVIEEVLKTDLSSTGLTADSLEGLKAKVNALNKKATDDFTKKELAGIKVKGKVYELVAEIDKDNPYALKISAVYKDGHQGVVTNASATVELEGVGTGEMNTLEVFDYVYFADNNGQLNSSYIIANGDVGSNGDFELKDATVNGYVSYLNNLTLNSAHAWLQGAYMGRVAAEFMLSTSDQKTIEQARPTNPVVTDTGKGKGTAKAATTWWDGGYDEFVAASPYEMTENPPTPVAHPGDEPQVPPEVQCKVTENSKNPF